MKKTVVGLFHGADQAQEAMQDLKRAGLSDARTFGSASGTGSTGVKSELTSAGVPGDEADRYAREVQHGQALVVVRTEDTDAQRAMEIMERHGTSGARAGRAGPMRGTTGETTGRPGRAAGEIREQEVQEEIRVGKRPVERPGVRVSTHVTEQPVEQQVQLHEEKVKVERRPADRPASEADLRRGDQEFVVTERSEEPVVQKQARVVGEVAVTKEARERTETIRDRVRRKEVHVERGGTMEPGAASPAYGRYEADFREHHRKYDKSGLDYEDAAPAYRYGVDLSEGTRFKGRDWKGIKSDVQRDWEKYNPGTWDDAEHAIKYGWDKAHGKA
jgi:stress response protein YsnF